MTNELLPFSEVLTFHFTKQPISIPADLRYFRKIALVLLVLKLCSNKSKASILKLQFLNWALASNHNMKMFVRYFREDKILTPVIIHLDPALNRVIELALADNLIETERAGRIHISNKGDALLTFIMNDMSLLSEEKSFLLQFGKKTVTEARIKSLIKASK